MVLNGKEYPMGVYSINDLEPGQEGTISEIKEDDKIKDRLNAIGLIKGTKIKMITAGMGLKVYEIRGGQFALRNSDAKNIKVL